jgi:hypothetical protein
MSFRLTNAPTQFMYMMNYIFMAEFDKFIMVFIDDILIYSKNAKSMRDIFALCFSDYEIINSMQNSANVSSGWAKIHFFGM